MKIRLNDNVLIISGKYRNKTGKVIRVDRKNNRVVVEKVNIRTKHIKKKQGQPGQIIHFEAPLHVSNVAVICPNCEKKTRVSHHRLESGKKQRICKKCKQTLDINVEKSKKKGK